MIVVIPYYNFCGNQIVRENHIRTLEHLDKQGVAHLTIEAYKSKPDLKDLCTSPAYISVQVQHALWYKENLINYAGKLLAEDHPYICWLDSGILLSDGWADEAIKGLQKYDVVQCFKDGDYLNADGSVQYHRCGYICNEYKSQSTPLSHGGSFAARSSVFQLDFPFIYEHNIVGGADTVFLQGICKNVVYEFVVGPKHLTHKKAWIKRVADLKLAVGYINASYKHLWHTSDERRVGHNRHKILVRYNYNPSTDIIYNNGIIELVEQKAMAIDIEDFLINRTSTGDVRGADNRQARKKNTLNNRIRVMTNQKGY